MRARPSFVSRIELIMIVNCMMSLSLGCAGDDDEVTGGAAAGMGGFSSAAAGASGHAGGGSVVAGKGGVAAAGNTGRAGAGAGMAGASGMNGAAGAVSEGCKPGSGDATINIERVRVTGPNAAAPVKGDTITMLLTVSNNGPGARRVAFTPLLDSRRFSDYRDAQLGSRELMVCEGTTEVSVSGGPFFVGKGADAKQYALGSGDYAVSGVTIQVEGQPERVQRDLPSNTFKVATSERLLVPVVYDERYFKAIKGETFTTPEAYLERAYRRPNEIFTPSNSGDPDGPGDYQSFPGGFDAMMKVQHVFHSFPGFPGENTTTDGWCEDAAAYGQRVLGMSERWDTRSSETRPERHGFDYLIALTPDMGGGVACGWLDVQVSSLINDDLDRQQVIAVHESGHIFGAPHCDDVGNGSGGSLQGYVMCSGEKHEHYPAQFVWHATSTEQMHPHWN